jgi:hypothetical protein
MRILWRELRMDLMAIACLGFAVAFLLLDRPAYAIAALGLAVFCVISLRMKGDLALRVGEVVLLSCTFDDPQEVILKAEVSEAGEDPRAEGRVSLSSRESPAD